MTHDDKLIWVGPVEYTSLWLLVTALDLDFDFRLHISRPKRSARRQGAVIVNI